MTTGRHAGPTLTAAEQRLIAGFAGPIEPVPTSVMYRIAIALVAGLMLLLPMIYLGLIGAVAYGLWWHVTQGIGNLDMGRGRHAGTGAFIVIAGPLVLGGVLLFFMLKPLLARRAKAAEPISLDPQQEPVLAAFVEKLCTSVGAPVPTRIDVVCEVNASASFRRGIWSMSGQDLVLTIGLPLVACQNLKQFTGVLAHEFGHFAQGAGMRASYLIRMVNFWFARVVYERDAWDERLVRWGEFLGQFHVALTIFAWSARLMVWLTRRILWVLMMIGHLCSTWLSRQMEFDADRHAARVVGGEAFGSALQELPVVAMAEQGAHADLGNAWNEQRLADDLPALIRANIPQIPEAQRTKLISAGLTESTGMYATHPATRDRLANGLRDAARPIFAASGEATQLFRDFAGLCKQVTMHWYREAAGLPVDSARLVPTTALVAEVEQQLDANKAWIRYAQGIGPFAVLRSGGWSADRESGDLAADIAAERGATEVPRHPDAIRQGLIAAREALCAKASAIASAVQTLDAMDEQITQLRTAGLLIKAGISVNARSFGLPRSDAAAVSSALRPAEAKRKEAEAVCAQMVAVLRQRLAFLPADEETARLQAGLSALSAQRVRFIALMEHLRALANLCALIDSLRTDEKFGVLLRGQFAAQHTRLHELRRTFASIAYPFPQAARIADLAAFLTPTMPGSAEDADAIMHISQDALRRANSLAYRCCARLAQLGEAQEHGFGLAALKDPVEPKPADG